MTRWVLVRHAESRANSERWLSGHVDVGLTARGRAQALRLVPQLAAERIRLVVSSDLQRAADTARLAMRGRSWGLRTLPGLRERALGDWSRRSLDSLDDALRKRVLHGFHTAPPGGESLAQVARRATAALAALEPAPEVVLVVAHGGTLRALLGLLDAPQRGAEERAMARHHVPNATPYIRHLASDAWTRLHHALIASP